MPAEAKTKRNEEIWRLYNEEHMTKIALARLYGVTHTRVSQIIQQEKKKHDMSKAITDSRDLADYCLRDRMILIFDFLDRDNTDVLGRKHTSNVRSAMYCLLRRYLPIGANNTPKEFLDWFMSLRYDELLHIRSMGTKKAAIIEAMQDCIRENPEHYRKWLLDGCTEIKPKNMFLYTY